ncbi:MAG: hypothetical protein AAFP84_10380, partial [Actinomycetota bacterium]
MSDAPNVADPRPDVDDGRILGARCQECGRAVARRIGRCERCGGGLVNESFGPGGTVWSATAVHLPVGPRTAGFVLVSVDLDGRDGATGPRVLMRSTGTDVPAPGTVVTVAGRAPAPTDDLLCTPELDSVPEQEPNTATPELDSVPEQGSNTATT